MSPVHFKGFSETSNAMLQSAGGSFRIIASPLLICVPPGRFMSSGFCGVGGGGGANLRFAPPDIYSFTQRVIKPYWWNEGFWPIRCFQPHATRGWQHKEHRGAWGPAVVGLRSVVFFFLIGNPWALRATLWETRHSMFLCWKTDFSKSNQANRFSSMLTESFLQESFHCCSEVSDSVPSKQQG